MYIGRDLNNSGRLFYRSLVALPGVHRPDRGPTPLPTSPPTPARPTDGGLTWSFTIKDGVKWEDGQDITCEDFAYGASRNFATDVIIGGPSNYLFTYLDIPTGDDGLPAYKGPYTGEGQDLFDKAVTCDGKTITYHLKKAWPDFPLSIAHAALPRPVPQGPGQGRRQQLLDLLQRSLQARRHLDRGHGRHVRSQRPVGRRRPTPIRKALPDKWDFREGDDGRGDLRAAVRRQR